MHFLIFQIGKDGGTIDWTIVKLLRFSEDCELRYIEMSEEELDRELAHLDKGIRTKVRQCIQSYKWCRKIYGKSGKSRSKAIATYPELESCPLSNNPEGLVYQDTRGNMSPRILSKHFSLWVILTLVLRYVLKDGNTAQQII